MHTKGSPQTLKSILQVVDLSKSLQALCGFPHQGLAAQQVTTSIIISVGIDKFKNHETLRAKYEQHVNKLNKPYAKQSAQADKASWSKDGKRGCALRFPDPSSGTILLRSVLLLEPSEGQPAPCRKKVPFLRVMASGL